MRRVGQVVRILVSDAIGLAFDPRQDRRGVSSGIRNAVDSGSLALNSP